MNVSSIDHDGKESVTRFVEAIWALRRPLCDRPPKHRLLILSTPRSGSTLLAEYIRGHGQLGMPTEYWHPFFLEFAAKHRLYPNPGSGAALMQFLESNFQSDSGVFAMKVHAHQIANLLKTPASVANWLKCFDRVLSIRREDMLAQAVSLARAKTTGRYLREGMLGLNPSGASQDRTLHSDPSLGAVMSALGGLHDERALQTKLETLVDTQRLTHLTYEALETEAPAAVASIAARFGVTVEHRPLPFEPGDRTRVERFRHAIRQLIEVRAGPSC